MASAKKLFNNLGGSGGGVFPKPAAKPVIPTLPEDADKADKHAGKHFDSSQKGHNLKKGSGGASGQGGTVPVGVRPKV